MHEWKAVGIVVEGEPILVGGLNPWALEWHCVQAEPVQFPHPSYPNQRHGMKIYEINSGERHVRFAAGELSANVWGFYVPVGG